MVITRRIAGHNDVVAEPADAAGHEYAVRAAAPGGELVAVFFQIFLFVTRNVIVMFFIFRFF